VANLLQSVYKDECAPNAGFRSPCPVLAITVYARRRRQPALQRDQKAQLVAAAPARGSAAFLSRRRLSRQLGGALDRAAMAAPPYRWPQWTTVPALCIVTEWNMTVKFVSRSERPSVLLALAPCLSIVRSGGCRRQSMNERGEVTLGTHAVRCVALSTGAASVSAENAAGHAGEAALNKAPSLPCWRRA
jgi:hypothetical protein